MNALLGVNQTTSEPTVNLARTYDNRMRLLSEVDSSPAAATVSTGTLNISGTEQQVAGPPTAGTGSITITGSDGQHLFCTPPARNGVVHCNESADTGIISVTIDGFVAYVDYGSGSTDSNLASAMASALSASGSPVVATATGNVVNITSIATGTGSNYAFSISNGNDFSGTDSGATLTGGSPAGGLVSDSGTITVSVNGVAASPVSWGSTSNPQSLASLLASAIRNVPGMSLTAVPSGSSVTVSSQGTGLSTDWPLTVTVTHSNPSVMPSFTVGVSGMSGGGTGTPLYAYSIPSSGGYAPNGNLLSVTDSVMGSWSYSYDNLNRLALATANSGNYMNISVAGAQLSWLYDSFGNRTQQNSTSVLFPSSWVAYAANNRTTSIGVPASATGPTATFQYDAAGNVTYDGTNSYVYYGDGRLCASSSNTGGVTQYIYDAEGSRVAKGSVSSLSCDVSSNGFVATNSYVVGQGGEQLSEFAQQSGTWTWKHSNVFAWGRPLATYTAAGSQTYFNLTDWLGTKRVEIAPDGSTNSWQSLPFGDGLMSVGGGAVDDTEHHFTGKERDLESGNDYFGARYFESNVGRFMTPDQGPLHFTNPQSFDRYVYALNNPFRYVDADGMDPIDAKLLWKVQHFDAWATPIANRNIDDMEMNGCGICSKRTYDALQKRGTYATNAFDQGQAAALRVGARNDLFRMQMESLADGIKSQVLAWANLPSTTAAEVHEVRDRLEGLQQDINAPLESVKSKAGKFGTVGSHAPGWFGFIVDKLSDGVSLLSDAAEGTFQNYLAGMLYDELHVIANKKDEEEQEKRCRAKPTSDGCSR